MLCQKYRMAAAAIMKCYLDTLDHSRGLMQGWNYVLIFHANRFTTFRDMVI